MADPYIGQITMFAGPFNPAGWADCDGQIALVNQNQALFGLLGTTYGGNGTLTFGLPDLRGRVPIHKGTGPGLTPRNLGDVGGTEEVSITPGQVPAHSHAWQVTTDPPTESRPSGNVTASDLGPDIYRSPATPSVQMHPNVIPDPGGGAALPHNNMMPFLTVRFIIALVGVFPA